MGWSSCDDEGAARSISRPDDAESLQRPPFSLSVLPLVRRLPLVAHTRSCCMHTGRVMLGLLLLQKRPCPSFLVGVLPPMVKCHLSRGSKVVLMNETLHQPHTQNDGVQPTNHVPLHLNHLPSSRSYTIESIARKSIEAALKVSALSTSALCLHPGRPVPRLCFALRYLGGTAFYPTINGNILP